MASEPSKGQRRKLSDLIHEPTTNEELREALNEMKGSPDRSAALVAAANLDHEIEKAILLKMVILNDEMFNEIFRNTAPLASFGSKIRMGYALGIYGRITYSDLTKISRIRNVFAHSPRIITFRNDEICELCRNMGSATAYEHSKGREALFPNRPPPNVFPPSTDPRFQFLEAVFTITIGLMGVINAYYERGADPDAPRISGITDFPTAGAARPYPILP